MSAAFELYTKLKQTSNDEERAEVIAQAFDALEARFPQITDLATQGHVRETELRLQKEIKEVEARLQGRRAPDPGGGSRLQEIKGVELQIGFCRSRSRASNCRSGRSTPASRSASVSSRSVCTKRSPHKPVG